MSEQDPTTPPAGGVGEHLPETPNEGDVDQLAGEFGELDKVREAAGGGQQASDPPGDESPAADGE